MTMNPLGRRPNPIRIAAFSRVPEAFIASAVLTGPQCSDAIFYVSVAATSGPDKEGARGDEAGELIYYRTFDPGGPVEGRA
jgi:hypothetical protein